MLELFRQYIKYYRDNPSRLERRSSATIRHYSNKYCLVSDFLFETGRIKIKAIDFNKDVCQELFNYLDNKEYAHNYCIRVVCICISVLDFGAKNGIIPVNPATYWHLKKTPPKEPIYFSPDQIKSFEQYKTAKVMRRKAADMFILQLHTGISYGDFAEIQRSHIINFKGTKYFIKPRHKTKNKQVVPLSPIAEVILEKYDYKMKLLSNPLYNRQLKLVAKDLNIPHELKCKDGRVIFMMNKLNNEGYSMEAVSKMGGHRTVRTTEAYYAQVDINLIHNELISKTG